MYKVLYALLCLTLFGFTELISAQPYYENSYNNYASKSDAVQLERIQGIFKYCF